MAGNREAWVAIPTSEELRPLMPPGARHPYDFGFFPAMARLIRSHGRLGAPLGRLYGEVMFEPGVLERREREMVAAVASAAQDCFY